MAAPINTLTKKHIVIIPIYNKLDVVKTMLSFYMKNTNFNNCITYIIDDGSSNETKQYLEEFSETHQNIKLFRNAKNIGKPKLVLINLFPYQTEPPMLHWH